MTLENVWRINVELGLNIKTYHTMALPFETFVVPYVVKYVLEVSKTCCSKCLKGWSLGTFFRISHVAFHYYSSIQIPVYFVMTIILFAFQICLRVQYINGAQPICVNGQVRIATNWSSFSETWWRHQMEIFSALLALCGGNSPVTGEFPSQRPVTRSFDVFFDLRLNKRMSKQSWGWWLRRHHAHYDVIVMSSLVG